MRKTIIFSVLAAVVLATFAGAQNVGKVAANPATLPAMLAEMTPADIPAFAGKVATAICVLPEPLDDIMAKLVVAANAFLQNTPSDQHAAMYAALINAIVPAEILPQWVDQYKPSVDGIIVKMADDKYGNLVQSTVKQSVELADENRDREIINGTFAIILLARSKDPKEIEALVEKNELDKALSEQISAALTSAASGNFTGLFSGSVADGAATPGAAAGTPGADGAKAGGTDGGAATAPGTDGTTSGGEGTAGTPGADADGATPGGTDGGEGTTPGADGATPDKSADGKAPADVAIDEPTVPGSEDPTIFFPGGDPVIDYGAPEIVPDSDQNIVFPGSDGGVSASEDITQPSTPTPTPGEGGSKPPKADGYKGQF